jgi:hypothetical protein
MAPIVVPQIFFQTFLDACRHHLPNDPLLRRPKERTDLVVGPFVSHILGEGQTIGVEADGESVGQCSIEIKDDPTRSVPALARVIHVGDSTSRHLRFANRTF